MMIEAAVPAVIAVITGGGVLFTRVHNRIHDLDKRIDSIELKVASSYVSKQEFLAGMNRMEDHMIRIEEKLDELVRSSRPCPPSQ